MASFLRLVCFITVLVLSICSSVMDSSAHFLLGLVSFKNKWSDTSS